MSPLWVLFGVFVVAAIIVISFLLPGVIGAPYVPSSHADLEKAFSKLYKLSRDDLLVDLGAGDGVVLKVAAAHGARALGVEINPFLAAITSFRLRKIKTIRVTCGDMYRFKLPPETTVVYAYANNFTIPRLYKRLQAETKRLNKTLYLISNAFDYKEAKPQKHIAPYYLYIIKS